MANNALAQLLLGAGVLAALAAGFWLIGGPETARMENRDEKRMMDLRALQAHAICLAKANAQTLPETLTGSEGCPAPRLDDRFTDAPYRYARLSPTAFEVCAGFEMPERMRDSPQFDPDTGCLRVTYAPA
jgi:hypothetical protein